MCGGENDGHLSAFSGTADDFEFAAVQFDEGTRDRQAEAGAFAPAAALAVDLSERAQGDLDFLFAHANAGIGDVDGDAARLRALRFDGNAPIARILVGMQMDDLSPDYIKTRNAKIEAVTLEDVKRVAGELMKPDELRFVVVGQPEGLEATVGQ